MSATIRFRRTKDVPCPELRDNKFAKKLWNALRGRTVKQGTAKCKIPMSCGSKKAVHVDDSEAIKQWMRIQKIKTPQDVELFVCEHFYLPRAK